MAIQQQGYKKAVNVLVLTKKHPSVSNIPSGLKPKKAGKHLLVGVFTSHRTYSD